MPTDDLKKSPPFEKPSNPPRLEVTEEVRFAVVMYGGISLAIYMNGIAQELLHLVRSTSPAEAGGDESRAVLTPSEKVYRKLGQMLVSGEPMPEIPRQSPRERSGAYRAQKSLDQAGRHRKAAQRQGRARSE
jgi:hypothetical protein